MNTRQGSFEFHEGEGSAPSLYYFERDLAASGYARVAGLDEAGRGPLAGPVVAACVALRPDDTIAGLDDSKKLSEPVRDALVKAICARSLDFGVGVVEAPEIDRINILEATKMAMLAALAEMREPPDFLLIDALTLDCRVPQRPLIKGDARSASIAAASILAKTTRDRIMRGLDAIYPAYGFAGHKGYGCKTHLEAIRRHGPCPAHRMSFRGVRP